MTVTQLYKRKLAETHNRKAAAWLTLAELIQQERATGLLTVAQAAERFNVSKRTIYRMLDDGLPHVKARGAIRINSEDLQSYLNQGETLFG
jgi:excisionase family DNA binding protein